MTVAQTGNAVRSAAPSTAAVLGNFAGFQIGWFACVLSAARDWPWAGTLIAAVIVGVHACRAARPQEEAKLLAIALVTGLVCDSLLFSAGWIDFRSGVVVPGMAPHWILAMWALFATTLNVSLAWLKQRLPTGAVLGAIAGPLAYWGGARLGAVTLADPVPALAALSLVWALVTPLLSCAARRYDGIGERRENV